jgi:hypothetical protein
MVAFGVVLAMLGGAVAVYSGLTTGSWEAVGLGAGIIGLSVVFGDPRMFPPPAEKARSADGDRPA